MFLFILTIVFLQNRIFIDDLQRRVYRFSLGTIIEINRRRIIEDSANIIGGISVSRWSYLRQFPSLERNEIKRVFNKHSLYTLFFANKRKLCPMRFIETECAAQLVSRKSANQRTLLELH